MTIPRCCLTVLLALVMGGCSDAAPPATGEVAVTAPPAPVPVAATPAAGSATAAAPTPIPLVSLHELMRDVIDPNAQRLWRAVSYVATADGVQETMPTNAMDWDGLRQSAMTLLEVSYGLTLPGREVATQEYEDVRQDFHYTAEEITRRWQSNRDDWNSIATGMGTLVQDTLATIERRDIFGLTETSAAINQACEACHASYWYQP